MTPTVSESPPNPPHWSPRTRCPRPGVDLPVRHPRPGRVLLTPTPAPGPTVAYGSRQGKRRRRRRRRWRVSPDRSPPAGPASLAGPTRSRAGTGAPTSRRGRRNASCGRSCRASTDTGDRPGRRAPRGCGHRPPIPLPPPKERQRLSAPCVARVHERPSARARLDRREAPQAPAGPRVRRARRRTKGRGLRTGGRDRLYFRRRAGAETQRLLHAGGRPQGKSPARTPRRPDPARGVGNKNRALEEAGSRRTGPDPRGLGGPGPTRNLSLPP